jgi:hypothetical protein
VPEPVDRATFEAVQQRVIQSAPPGLSREQFEQLLDAELGKVTPPARAEERRLTKPVSFLGLQGNVERAIPNRPLQQQTADEFALGLRAGGMESLENLRRGWNWLVPTAIEIPAPPEAWMTTPETTPGRLGYLAERAAEFLVPATKVGQAVRGAAWGARTLAQAGTAAGVAGVQSGLDPTSMILAGGTGAAGDVALAGAGATGRAIMRAARGAREGGVGGAIAGAIRAVSPGEPRVLLTQGLKPISTKVRFGQSADRAIPELKLSEAALGRPIAGVDDLLEATADAKQRLWGQLAQVRGTARGFEVNLSPVAEAMERAITKKVRLENPAAATRMEEAASVYRQPFSLDDAEQLLKETNAELEGFYAKYPPSQRKALLNDPEWAKLNAQAKALRSSIDDTFDRAVEGAGDAAKELRRRYGAVLDIETETWRRMNVAARQQPQSLSEQVANVHAAADMARGLWRLAHFDVSGAADLAAAYAGRSTAGFLKEQQTTDALIRRAFAGYDAPYAPVPIPPARPVRGALPRGPLITPPPADPSGGVSVPAAYPQREVRGLLGPKTGGPILPPSGRTISLPGEAPIAGGRQMPPPAPLAYGVDPFKPVAKGGFWVKQFSGEPEAEAAAIASPEMQGMLRRMLADLETFTPQPGKLTRKSVESSEDIYLKGAAGSPILQDLRHLSGLKEGYTAFRDAIEHLLTGKRPTNRAQTAALDAAMSYLNPQPGFKAGGPLTPADIIEMRRPAGDDEAAFEAFSRTVDELRRR